MAVQILTLEDLRECSLEDVLRQVLAQGEALRVCLPQGEMVMILPPPRQS